MTKRLHMVFAVTTVLAPGIPHAQTYSSKAIRLVVPYAGGSSPDISTRRLANELSRQMGYQVVVDNCPGASAIIGTELVGCAAPDGYTFGYIGTNFVTNLSLFKTLPYDSIRDFQPVIITGANSHLLAVLPSLPIRSVKELIEMARANPDTLSYSSTGNGSSPHLTMELLKSMTGVSRSQEKLRQAGRRTGRRHTGSFRLADHATGEKVDGFHQGGGHQGGLI